MTESGHSEWKEPGSSFQRWLNQKTNDYQGAYLLTGFRIGFDVINDFYWLFGGNPYEEERNELKSNMTALKAGIAKAQDKILELKLEYAAETRRLKNLRQNLTSDHRNEIVEQIENEGYQLPDDIEKNEDIIMSVTECQDEGVSAFDFLIQDRKDIRNCTTFNVTLTK